MSNYSPAAQHNVFVQFLAAAACQSRVTVVRKVVIALSVNVNMSDVCAQMTQPTKQLQSMHP